MKYHLDESESFRELYMFRELSKNVYLKQEKYLLERKDKLFRNKDLTKWGGFNDLQQMELLKNELL